MVSESAERPVAEQGSRYDRELERLEPTTLVIDSSRPSWALAFADLIGGLRKWRLWGRVGWLDIRRRYRRTIIGPFWNSISLLVFVTVMGAVGSGLLSKESEEYLPFLVAGMVVWMMLSSVIIESLSVFLNGLVRQMKFEYSILIYTLLWRNLIVFFHNMIVYVLIFGLMAPQKIQPVILLAIPALVLLLVNGAWIALLLGMFALRFRDTTPLVQSLVQISMFVTPLFWPPESLSGIRRVVFVGFNPLYHLLAIARDPLLGIMPRANSYIAVGAITVIGWSLTLVCFRRFRSRVPYWL